ncbi:MAG: ThuA domain-containing protein [Planctomycetaceae bacterium]
MLLSTRQPGFAVPSNAKIGKQTRLLIDIINLATGRPPPLLSACPVSVPKSSFFTDPPRETGLPMPLLRFSLLMAIGFGILQTCDLSAAEPIKQPVARRKILLIAGETAKVDKVGHHDYLAGCDCLQLLLRQTPGIEAVRINDGWPNDEALFDGASSLVFYSDGGGKQAFLKTPERISQLQSLVDNGVGVVMIHQAVDFPDEQIQRGQNWLGGVYAKGKSGRGHWDSEHHEFPKHPISHGVTEWKINDGWLNGLSFVDEMRGITPLVWSGKEVVESKAGIDAHIVSWTYDRPQGGRSFSFTGLDAHSALELPGVRQLLVNGILWSANVDIPEQGAPCQIEKEALEGLLTPRESKPAPTKSPANTPPNSPKKPTSTK